MKILILNSGAKDTAIAWWFSKSRLISELYVAPGNPGTESFAINLPDVNIGSGKQVLEACRTYNIDFVFIGTEVPLVAGVVDYLNENGISTFGAPLAPLKLETDKVFAREFARRCAINIPDYRVFENLEDLKTFLEREGEGKFYTLKSAGFAPSSSIINSSDYETLAAYATPLLKKGPLLLEDHISGVPVTVTILLDRLGYLLFPLCSEYTKREHKDESIVTGGMGAVCPIPLSNRRRQSLINKLIVPIVKQMKEENLLYNGVLTLALVHKNNTPYLVDFHLRFNDPAAQAILPLIESDPVDIIRAMQNNSLSSFELKTNSNSSVSVVIAGEGYPQKPKKGVKFNCSVPQLLDNNLTDIPHVFLGAVKKDETGNLITTGGRSATVVATDENIMSACNAVYKAIRSIEFKGSWYREDIGEKFFNSLAGN